MANMNLNNLKYTKGSRDHKQKTLGRGYGSGYGKRSTRGQKGQHARKSGNVRLGFEGGQTPLYRKIPKVGFNNVNKKQYKVFTTDQIIKLKKIDRDVLVKNKMISKNDTRLIKIIAGKAKVSEPIDISTNKISNGAKKIIINAGGKVNILK